MTPYEEEGKERGRGGERRGGRVGGGERRGGEEEGDGGEAGGEGKIGPTSWDIEKPLLQ